MGRNRVPTGSRPRAHGLRNVPAVMALARTLHLLCAEQSGACDSMRRMVASTLLHEFLLLLPTVASFIGGGAVIAAIISQSTASRHRRIDALRTELQEFYGPLGFLAASTRMLSEHRSKLVNLAVTQGVPQPHDDAETRIKVGLEAGRTIDVGFKFNEKIVSYNLEIHGLLRQKYHLIDPADLELFHSAMMDFERMQVESGPDGNIDLPLSTYARVGILLYTRDEFTDRLGARLDEKQRAFHRLLQPWWKRRFR